MYFKIKTAYLGTIISNHIQRKMQKYQRTLALKSPSGTRPVRSNQSMYKLIREIRSHLSFEAYLAPASYWHIDLEEFRTNA